MVQLVTGIWFLGNRALEVKATAVDVDASTGIYTFPWSWEVIQADRTSCPVSVQRDE
jgi:hypothetical protein